MRLTLPDDRDQEGVRSLVARLIENEDAATTQAVTDYLTMFELLATGVNVGVFDIDIIQRLAGTRIRALACNYGPWISYRRERFSQRKLYIELTQLAQEIEARQELTERPATLLEDE